MFDGLGRGMIIGHTMVRRSLALVGLMGLAGCAQEGAPHPSYIGLSDLSASSAVAAPMPSTENEQSEALRHIQSNKVLSAMAFQKVTGQMVDPDSLSGRE